MSVDVMVDVMVVMLEYETVDWTVLLVVDVLVDCALRKSGID